MDIKGLVRNVIPFAPRVKTEQAAQTHSKTDASNDREGNGQSAGEEQKRRHHTPEEIQEIIKYLEGLAGVKDNGLTVRLSSNDGINVILVEDRQSKVVRRIPESEFGLVMANREKKSGHLLNRAL